ncbi:kelch-like protein 40 [Dendronephthya gigantea]|uniref:kelch-like protein 40 n=1 Tax=Dendronephthya gigantea TaxID=151771 RepID=UPI001068F706|nr:kelch-like protein 40 [Dendronephthya gigantea]
MAFCTTYEKYGYDSSRFESTVDENLHCSICYNVLREPRMCRNNEHIFCLVCITEHLTVNRQNCPECNEHLTVDTLRRPRVVNNLLLKLKINCEYASRGCPEFTCVEDLKTHVENCGYAPVLCSNENCGEKINKREKAHHETEVCGFRKVEYRDYERIQKAVERMEGRLTELDEKMESNRSEVRSNRAEMEKIVGKFDEIKHEVKKEVKESLKEVKLVMNEMLEKLNAFQPLSKLPSSAEGMISEHKDDILIAGGYGMDDEPSEIYSWVKNAWFNVSPMNKEYEGASSFICDDKVFVVGEHRTIDTMDLNELHLVKWEKFLSKLPCKYAYHQTVVYQQRIIHIGGNNEDEEELCNVIGELQLGTPCIMKELCRMPEPRGCHSAEVFEDKVLILGGQKSESCESAVDSVFEFDIKKNECKEMPPLPHPVTRMATVRWQGQAVILGGLGKDEKALNAVFMYDCKTGKITNLPFMLQKRYDCCAVITGSTIVVMGGVDDDSDELDSVECFTMGASKWEYLPSMNSARSKAFAELLPSTRK